MEDEVDQTVETTEENTQPEAQDTKPAGYNPVDLSDLPPEKAKQVEERINYLYSQVKTNNRSLNEYRTIAQQQSQQIEDLMNGVGQVVGHLQEQDLATTEANINFQLRQAIQDGDVESQIALNNQLLDLKVKKMSGKKETPQPKKPQAQAPVYSEMARDEGLSQEEEDFVSTWENETDQSGRLLRPWAFREHPEFTNGLRETEAVFTNPRFKNMTVDQKMAEVDRRMGVKKSNPPQTVLGGRLTTPNKNPKITMTPKQQEIAVKTRFGGPKAKSDAEHIEAYRKQIERASQSKRSR